MKRFAQLLNIFSIFGIFIVAFFLPLKTSLSNIGLIILIGTTIISFVVHGVNWAWIKKKQAYYTAPWILMVPILLGMFYSPWPGEAWNELSKSVFLLAVPLLLFRKDTSEINLYKYAAWGLIGGVVVNASFLLSINFYEFFTGNDKFRDLFSYWYTSHSFVEPIGEGMHPLYLGSYYVLALAFLVFEKFGIPKSLKFIATLLILLSIGFLNSRITYFSAVLVGLLFALDRLSWRAFALSITTVLVALAVTFPFFEKTYIINKAINGTVWDLTKNIGTHNTSASQRSDSRMSRWLVALELIEEKPLLGHGTGAEDKLLMKKYRAHEMQNSIKQGYNSHNQLLGFLINFGILGTFFLVAYFVTNIYRSFKWKELAYISFLIIFGSLCLVENYLDRNMGINFVALFGTLFLLNNLKRRQKENSKNVLQENKQP